MQPGVGPDCFVAGPPRNDDEEPNLRNINAAKTQQNTTNRQDGNKVPPLGGGGGFLTRPQRYALRQQLKKEGWQTIEEAFNDVYPFYLEASAYSTPSRKPATAGTCPRTYASPSKKKPAGPSTPPIPVL
jgi:hypothetical protein